MMEVSNLYNKDNVKAYKTLLELETLSTESNELYNYFNEFLKMLNSEKSLVRVRGFRMICSLSKWDIDNKINKNIDDILKELDDELGISIRQCLKSINLILLYKPELTDKIQTKLLNLNLTNYKENMQSLIKKDIDNILENL